MLRLNARFSTDTLSSDVKSLNQSTCAQFFSHKVGFNATYPMESSTGDSLGYLYRDFSHDFGIPEHLTFDGYSAQVGRNTLFIKTVRQYDTQYNISSTRRPNEKPAEVFIRELKKRWYLIMLKKKVPERLWDYGLVWISETGNLSVSSLRCASGRTPLEYITGETPDTSEYFEFTFYDWVTYRTNEGLGELSIGRWLDVSHEVGQAMSYWILPVSGIVISCTTVQRLTRSDKARDKCKSRIIDYYTKIAERLGVKNSDRTKQAHGIDRWNKLSISDEDTEFLEELNRVISDSIILDVPDDNLSDDQEGPTPVPGIHDQ